MNWWAHPDCLLLGLPPPACMKSHCLWTWNLRHREATFTATSCSSLQGSLLYGVCCRRLQSTKTVDASQHEISSAFSFRMLNTRIFRSLHGKCLVSLHHHLFSFPLVCLCNPARGSWSPFLNFQGCWSWFSEVLIMGFTQMLWNMLGQFDYTSDITVGGVPFCSISNVLLFSDSFRV